jgi:hypothetical protein
MTMKEGSLAAGSNYGAHRGSAPAPPLTAPITAGLLSWAVISAGFFGLKILMQERPEFVGQPMLVTKAELIQESPRVMLRKVSDDVSVVQASQPELSDVRFDLNGRRDYRGLRTVRDMSGHVQARYVVTNSFDEPSYVLFKCPHPRTENAGTDGLVAGELKLQTSTAGMQENTKDAWFWSGTLERHGSAALEVSYDVTSLKGVTYRVAGQDGNQVRQVRVTLHRQDLAAMRVDSGDGTKRPREDTIVWERHDFLAPDFFSATLEESRSLFSSISQLLEIGPLICLLFLVSVSSVLVARQELTAFQMFTIAAGYAVYFPLVLYLSANISFYWALILALVVPGALLANYARWLVGGKAGVLGAALFLVLYQIFPTLAAFAGWNRGMVLLCLGVVTLAVLINLQNRTLKLRAAAALLVAGLFLPPFLSVASEVQVILPAELVARPELKSQRTNSPMALLAFEPAEYKVRQDDMSFRIEATASVDAVRAGEMPVPLFGAPVYLEQAKFESAQAESARLVTSTNRLALFVQRPGTGTIRLAYRVPVVNREGKWHAQIPLLLGVPGNLQLWSKLENVEVVGGSLWTKTTANETTSYIIGVAGEETLGLEWREGGSNASNQKQSDGSKDFYGIGLTRAQNLTIVNSDGSCTHFAEYEVPVSQPAEFRLRLPTGARLLSVSVNNVEVISPVVADQLCRVNLPSRAPQQTMHLISFRLAYPPVRLGFAGVAEFSLPELFQTTGLLEWAVALPNGFETQILSCGLEAQKTSPDLERFGDYGRILKPRVGINLAKDLAPPGPVKLSLKYRQMVPGLFVATAQTNLSPASN